MKREYWQMSFDKWNPETGVLSELEKKGRIDWKRFDLLLAQKCGHCQERYTCSGCSLKGREDMDGNACCSDGKTSYFTLEEMADGDLPRNKRTALAIARRIFTQIMKDKPEQEEPK